MSFEVSADRRTILQVGAVVAVTAHLPSWLAPPALPPAPTLGEVQMRAILAADLSKAEAALESTPYWTTPLVRRAIARDRLAEFDRGEGHWPGFARRHPQGFADGLFAEEESRVELTERITEARKALDDALELSERPRLRAQLKGAVGQLSEFERGEGWRREWGVSDRSREIARALARFA